MEFNKPVKENELPETFYINPLIKARSGGCLHIIHSQVGLKLLFWESIMLIFTDTISETSILILGVNNNYQLHVLGCDQADALFG